MISKDFHEISLTLRKCFRSFPNFYIMKFPDDSANLGIHCTYPVESMKKEIILKQSIQRAAILVGVVLTRNHSGLKKV